MAMTGADFIDEVRENIRRNSDGVSDTRILRWVNWAKDFIADLHTYEEMKKNYVGSTTSSQKRYGFPTNMKDIYTMTLQSGAESRKLDYVHPRTMDRAVPRFEAYTEGKPSQYVDYGANFELFLIPDDEYTLNLRCTLYPDDLTNTSTAWSSYATCYFKRKDALISAIATVFGFYSLREVEDAAWWANNIVPELYAASLTSDHTAVDWGPKARQFTSGGALIGNWWKNPFTGRTV